MQARAFGAAEDLDVDFRARRPVIVTEILARCLRGADAGRVAPAEIWSWPVSRRTQALLAAGRASGILSLAALARCPQAACAEQSELELELQNFVRAEEAGPIAWNGAGPNVRLRLPAGEDQRDLWDAVGERADEAAQAAVGTRLVLDIDGVAPEPQWRMPSDWLPGVGAALAERDPTTGLRASLACAHCGHEFEAEVDLEALLLRRLESMQRALLADVHALASAYHWSEAEILALPAWRRSWYLAALLAQT